MGIANIVNTSGGGGGSSEIITHLVNSVDGAGLRLANSASIKCNDVAANRFGTADFSIEFVISQNAEVANSDIFTSSADYTSPTNPTAKSAAVIRWDVSGNGNLSLVIFNSTGTGAAYDFGVSLTADVDKPTHFVVSADRSANAVLFRNGAEVASVDISASSSENIGVGGYPAVVGLPNALGFKGNIYRLRTYSKLLSTDEAKNVFDRADVPTALVSNLLLDLDCAYANPTQSTVIQDRGPNNQDGTLNGTITQTNIIKQLNSVSARIGTIVGTPTDGEVLVDKIKVGTAAVAPDVGQISAAKGRFNGTDYQIHLDAPSGDDWYIRNPDGKLRFHNNTDRLTISSTGNVSMGSASSVYGRLFVDASTSGNEQNTALAIRGRDASSGYLALNVMNTAGDHGVLSVFNSGLTKLTGSITNGSGMVNTLQIKNGGTSAGDGGKLLFTAGTSSNGAGIGSTGQAFDSADLKFYTGGSNERLHIHHSTGLATFSNDVAYGDNARVYHGDLPNTGPSSSHDKYNFNFTFSGTYGVALITLDVAAGAGEVAAGRYTLAVSSTTGSTTQLMGSVTEVFKHNLGALAFADSGSSDRTFTLSVERTVMIENWTPSGSYKLDVTTNHRTLTLNSVTAST